MIGRLALHVARISAWNAARVVGRFRRNAALYGIAIMFGGTAYVAGVIAGGLWLATIFDAVTATAIIAGISALLALLVVAFASFVNKIEKSREAAVRRESLAVMSAALATGSALRSGPLLLALAGIGLAYFKMNEDAESEVEEA